MAERNEKHQYGSPVASKITDAFIISTPSSLLGGFFRIGSNEPMQDFECRSLDPRRFMAIVVTLLLVRCTERKKKNHYISKRVRRTKRFYNKINARYHTID